MSDLPAAPKPQTANAPQTNSSQASTPQENRPAGPGNPQSARRNQFQARLDNQKAQLERHGNFAEVVIRTTPEGTDMLNFARLWEYVLVQADRQTRGYVAKSSRADFELTRKDFEDCVDFMVQRIKNSVGRHKIDLSGTNFISRVAQRYQIVEKNRQKPTVSPAAAPQPVAPPVAATPMAEAPAAKPKRATKAAPAVDDEVDAL